MTEDELDGWHHRLNGNVFERTPGDGEGRESRACYSPGVVPKELDIKKAEHNFELWCWRRLLRVPWTAWRSNHSILKEINPEYSLEGLMLRLKLQHFGHLM